MVSLVDIVPQTRTIALSAGEIELRGLGLRQIADLLLRFPSLKKLVTEGAPTIDIDDLLLTAPDAIGAVIAEAAHQPDSADTIPDKLPLDDVVLCLLTIRELTLPADPSPFFDRLAKLLGGGAGPSGKARATKWRPASNGSLPPGTTLPRRWTTRLGNYRLF